VVKALVNESRRAVVIASRETAGFYRILGFSEVYGVDKPEEAYKLIVDLKSRRDIGLILVEESIMRKLGLDHMSLNERGLTPLVTVIPDTKEFLTQNPSLYYRKYAQRVIGYEVSF
jgi:vacuolar-type H+-ATPase subunit F/Vma7